MVDKPRADARAAMSAWRDYRGSHPLADAGSGFANDRCNGFLSNASSILLMLSAACEDADTLHGKGLNSEFKSRTGRVMAGALDGVSDLINLASFLLED